jgi:hypothetical protein
MSAKLIYFNFIGTNGVPDSPCAINASQIVYMYTTQTNKTAVVFTNGDLRVSNDTVQSFKSGQLSQGLGVFVSIGTPTRTGASAWPSANGEVLVNSSYIAQLNVAPSSGVIKTIAEVSNPSLVSSQTPMPSVVVMNQPASAPVVFYTAKSINDIVIDSKSSESPFTFIKVSLTQSSTNDPTIIDVYSNIGLTSTQVTGTRSAAGTYSLAFPSSVALSNASFFFDAPTGTAVPIIRATAVNGSSSVQLVTQSTGFTNADGVLSNTKINILSWPTLGSIGIGYRGFGGVVFHVDSSNKAYVLYEGTVSTGVVWSTPTGTGVSSVGYISGGSPATSGTAFSQTNSELITTAATGVGAAASALAFSATVNGITYDDWALPTEGALTLIYNNLGYAKGDPYNLSSFIPNATLVWASNQQNSTSGRAGTFNTTSGLVFSGSSKSLSNYALAIRSVQL